MCITFLNETELFLWFQVLLNEIHNLASVISLHT